MLNIGIEIEQDGFQTVHCTGVVDGASPRQALEAVLNEAQPVYNETELARQRAEEQESGYACGGGFASAPPSKPDRYGGMRTYADFTGADARRASEQFARFQEDRNSQSEPLMSGSDGAVRAVNDGEPIVLKPTGGTITAPVVYPDGNPKTLAGSKKPDLSVVPPVSLLHLATAMMNGAEKYGPFNWREQPISYRPYLAAAMRHLASCLDGEDFSADTVEAGLPVHHLGHVMACCAIVLDAIHCGTLNDNRPSVFGATGEAIEHYNKEKTLLPNAAA